MAPPDLTCIAFGAYSASDGHDGCPVIAYKDGVPVVCPCDCRDCKDAWWDKGRPIVRDGKLVRA